MAGIKVSGIEQLRAQCAQMSKIAANEAMDAAYKGAAQVYAAAIRAAAPVGRDPKNKSKKRPGHGELKGSVRIYKGKSTELMRGGTTVKLGRLLIGPAKDHGFYGFFLEKGWLAPTGPRFVVGYLEGKPITTGRRERYAHDNTHSQRGRPTSRKINTQHENWFRNAITYVEGAALQKAAQAFEAVMKRIT